MKNRLFFAILLFSCIGFTFAQPSGYSQLTGESKTAMAQSISSSASKLQTLKVNFTQEKTSKAYTKPVVSQGTLTYKSSDKLCWAYTSPRAYSILLNSTGSYLKTAKGSTKNKMLGEMGKLILNTISGSGLSSNADFNIEYYKKNDVVAYLTPKSKRFQEMYQYIEVYLNPQSYLATQVRMVEKNGDITVIKFSNHQKNVSVSDSVFQQ